MRSQEKVCATLFGVWMRTLDELFIREGAGEERRGQQGEIRCSLGASLKKKKESEFSLNNRKEKKRELGG